MIENTREGAPLRFTFNRLVVVESLLGKTLKAVIDELESPNGVSLTTLRALYAVGHAGSQLDMWMRMPSMGGAPLGVDLSAAGNAIEAIGTTVATRDVGAALAALFAEMAE
ncbi:hypothetical protein [Ancylobacter sp. SL191]|uniref:hypothetical protein n=1 Tax=Ancylobacter sp. SL191 TaxID=2995166 RepID=UPI00226DE20B|nr:hypothetical protein [Ancylobacter sp. SL191]WAC25748.1 hypothetical protein OU996_11970 [Ancylobacter sp. SL191]